MRTRIMCWALFMMLLGAWLLPVGQHAALAQGFPDDVPPVLMEPEEYFHWAKSQLKSDAESRIEKMESAKQRAEARVNLALQAAERSRHDRARENHLDRARQQANNGKDDITRHEERALERLENRLDFHIRQLRPHEELIEMLRACAEEIREHIKAEAEAKRNALCALLPDDGNGEEDGDEDGDSDGDGDEDADGS